VALDTRTRSSIYEKLVPVLGADDANALMTELPVADDELATKSFIRAELAVLETQLTVRMGAMVAGLASLMVILKLLA
jgi:hypothetical protein